MNPYPPVWPIIVVFVLLILLWFLTGGPAR